MGKIGGYAEIVAIIEDFFLGVIFDTFGRKYPLFIGMLASGLATGAIPMFTSLYPSYCILRIIISSGTIITMNVPLLPDYVQKDNIGRAGAYI